LVFFVLCLPLFAGSRAIDKAGGLDRYLLKTPDALLWSDLGSDLKFRLGLIYRHQQHQQWQQRLQQPQVPQLPPGDAAARLPTVSAQISTKRSFHSASSSFLPAAAAAALQLPSR
jgi:hypothetical protein